MALDLSTLKPCPFCGGEAAIELCGTQADITCQDCDATNGIQISDHFTDEERFNDPSFAFDMKTFTYAAGGIKRACEVLTKLWNTRKEPAND